MKVFAVGLLLAGTSFAQLAFEVASVKLAGPETRVGGMFTYPGGRISGKRQSLSQLIELAFQVQPFQIVGLKGWELENRYNLEAKPPADSAAAKSNPRNPKLPMNQDQRTMLQALLAERFGLVYHRETKFGPVYELVKAGKLRLQPAADKDEYPWVGGIYGGEVGGSISTTGIAGMNASMQLVAERLSPYLERPVLDKTGLPGSFDFRFDLGEAETKADLNSCIFLSVRGLGLKLEPAKGPIETIVVDQVTKPDEN